MQEQTSVCVVCGDGAHRMTARTRPSGLIWAQTPMFASLSKHKHSAGHDAAAGMRAAGLYLRRVFAVSQCVWVLPFRVERQQRCKPRLRRDRRGRRRRGKPGASSAPPPHEHESQAVPRRASASPDGQAGGAPRTSGCAAALGVAALQVALQRPEHGHVLPLGLHEPSLRGELRGGVLPVLSHGAPLAAGAACTGRHATPLHTPLPPPTGANHRPALGLPQVFALRSLQRASGAELQSSEDATAVNGLVSGEIAPHSWLALSSSDMPKVCQPPISLERPCPPPQTHRDAIGRAGASCAGGTLTRPRCCTVDHPTPVLHS